MGDFIGHAGTGIFVLLLATWWMYKGFSRYIKSKLGHGTYELQYSYTTKCRGKDVPIEQIIRVIFLSALLIGECLIMKFNYWDENGKLINTLSIMHLSYYFIFFVHCVTDLCMKSGIKGFPDNMDYFTSSLAFFWNALSLYYHVQISSRQGVDYYIHVMPTYPICFIAVSLMLMPFFPTLYFLDLMRCYGLIVMGTWFFHAAFILYQPTLKGSSPKSDWDLQYSGNTSFIQALLGFHLALAVVIELIVYQISYRIVVRRNRGSEYHKLDNKYNEDGVCLIVQG